MSSGAGLQAISKTPSLVLLPKVDGSPQVYRPVGSWTTRRGWLLIIFIPVVFLMPLCALVGQEKNEPGQRDVAVPGQTDATLPKIDLPEFLITGQETIDLPVSSKSVVEEERIVLFESPSPGRKDMDVTAAVKQQKDIAGPVGQMNGRVFGSFGNYVTPSIEGWFGKKYVDGAVVFHANFASSDGHVADAQWQKTGVELQGDFLSPQSFGVVAGSLLNGGIGFSGESYRAYGSANPSQLRSLNDVHVNLGLSSRTAKIEKPDDQVAYSGELSWNRIGLDDSVAASESEFSISGNAVTQWNTYQLSGSMEYKASGISMPLPPSLSAHSPQWFALRFSGKTFVTPSLQASLTLQQSVYRGNLSVSKGRLYPGVELQYFANDATSLYASFKPTVERNTLGSLAKTNKYVRNAMELQPSEVPLSISLGSDISFSDKVRCGGVFTYRTVQNYPVYIELDSAKVWDVMYLPEVSVTGFEARGAYQFSPENTGTLVASLYSTAVKNSSNSVPNVPLLTLAGTYRRAFDNGLVIEGFAEYVTKRWTDFAHTNANAGYVSVGGRGEIQLFENFRALVQVNNLFNRQFYVWDGYVERPFFVSLGVTYKW